MKAIIALSVVAALAMTPTAQAGGFFGKSGGGGLLGNVTAALGVKNVNVLNGTNLAIGNNSSIRSNIGSGNGILGLGGQNVTNSGNSQSKAWNSFNTSSAGKRR